MPLLDLTLGLDRGHDPNLPKAIERYQLLQKIFKTIKIGL